MAASGTARAQSSEGGDFGASGQSVKQGALPALGAGRGLPQRPTAAPPNFPPLRTAVPPFPPLRTAGPPGAAPPPTALADTAPPTALPGAASSTATLPGAVPPALPGTRPDAAAAALPPPSSYLSSAWNVWPHAWGYVPTLWSAWYRDSVQQARPATPAERAGAESPPTTLPEGPAKPTLTPAALLPPLSDPDSQGLPAPRLVRRRRYNLVISGTGILAATWAADRLLANGLSSRPEPWVPVIGPWFLLADQFALASPSAQTQVLLVIDGLLQAGGLSMALLGFVLTTKRYVVTVQPTRGDLIPREAP